MRLLKILAIAAVAGSFGLVVEPGSALAKIQEQQPAEFPARSYKGKQYVDSKGCVFIRAGIDGNVSWVPRVTRDRKTVCGFRPTNAGTAVAEAPTAVAEEIKVEAATPVVKPAPRRVAQAKKKRRAAPAVVRQKPKRKVAPPKPRVAKVAPVVVPQGQQRTVVAEQGGCPGASAISGRYLRGTGVRCGPQTQPVVGNHFTPRTQTFVVAGKSRRASVQAVPAAKARIAPVASEVTATTRIVPKHVAQNRINTRNVSVPRGYRPVWTDDRLNPKRAEQNLKGRSDMLLVWTQTLPRRLINQSTGRDVTASVPLVYPYTSVTQQRRDLGEVTIVQRDGQTVKRVVRHAKGKALKRKPVYSSRSAPQSAAAPKVVQRKVKASPALAGKKYVQVGTYGDAANAQRAAQKIARMGMAARIGKHRSGGKTYMSVQAGPFNGTQALRSAMRRLRGAGYADAFAR
ncbi:SPOR domain-containing protein [Sulfitobacter sp. M57]|uniref:SPOR domain-containing protein n=1 Tax=unclassified Sulfitobacter TaxID=196795 RepID=UPI0023E1582E|nr:MULTISPECIES: SPOR domain-containing protein [unclassified Sulfitobacter]MDF3415662.1 SPOR domain-containing protein [Sulfitobacter sp. KE5]MDF3423142.1 SPOR domain-containing protein [Sulfitobacter sp. KE43]MDF3434208.1 SPOR domain-containing protein [Sulfitobacter sp. KE42]MDF3459759.1 SPOR domain-containing protein [Sulfitobacter sp. S74]MDF3463746.1 SPOR domain-containing protein [Sulfitobacter sp. Ks18]